MTSTKEKMMMRIPPCVEFMMRVAKILLKKNRKPSGTTSGEKIAPARKVTAQEIKQLLRSLGINPGDVVMLHSSGAAVESMGIDASEMIDILQNYLTPQGTLAMPSHPKLAEINGGWVYKPQRTASTVGLLTEIFRRRDCVIRSRYPFCAAAAWGEKALELVGDHEKSFAPHDENSPYGKLAKMGGKCLCIGADLDRMTILHVAEDELRDEWPIEHFYDVFQITVSDENGDREITARKRSGWLWWYLAKFRWMKGMYRSGFVREAELGGVKFLAADASYAVHWMKTQVRKNGVNGTIYPLAKLNRFLKLSTPEL